MLVKSQTDATFKITLSCSMYKKHDGILCCSTISNLSNLKDILASLSLRNNRFTSTVIQRSS